MRQILVCALMFVIASSIFFVVGKERQREEKGGAQATDSRQANDQVEVKTDRFSGVTTVKLKPQVILDKPDHQLIIEIETKLGEKKVSDLEREEVKAIASFESQSKTSVDFGDEQLHFLIDGQQLNLGESDVKVDPYADQYNRLKQGFKIKESFLSIFDRSALEYFSKARHIEMRIGSVEFTLSQPASALLREYSSRVLALQKPDR
jgi:hypothetical protein